MITSTTVDAKEATILTVPSPYLTDGMRFLVLLCSVCQQTWRCALKPVVSTLCHLSKGNYSRRLVLPYSMKVSIKEQLIYISVHT